MYVYDYMLSYVSVVGVKCGSDQSYVSVPGTDNAAVEWEWAGDKLTWQKNQPQYKIIHQKYHMAYHGIEPKL